MLDKNNIAEHVALEALQHVTTSSRGINEAEKKLVSAINLYIPPS
jgi:hypothetical protein